MENKRVKLNEQQTENISKLYGLWDFVSENLENKISIIVWESDS